MTLLILLVISVTVGIATVNASGQGQPTPGLVHGFRPPSVPLVVVDPYLSVWSNADHLYDNIPRHWSGPPVCLAGMIRIDGKPYRFMALTDDLPSDHMTQTELQVYPTQTMYTFEQDGVQLNVTFSTPAIVTKGVLPILPLTVISYNVVVIDNKPHSVQLYYDNTAEGVASDINQIVEWDRPSITGYTAMRVGTTTQCYLCQNNDKINWGYWYTSTPIDSTLTSSITASTNARKTFANGGKLPPDDKPQPLPVSHFTVMALVWDFGMLQPSKLVSKHMSITYDQVFSMRYFGTAMAPLWKNTYSDVSQLIMATGFDKIIPMCDSMDKEVLNVLSLINSDKYTTIASLAWRQAVGGTVSVWNNVTNTTWMFLKEISSDGDVSTVDVLYPASPLFLGFNPETLRLLLLPVLDYANNQTGQYGLNIPYNLTWAPHHLGHWPICNLKPSMQEQMPMEESGNMIMMIAGVVCRSSTHDLQWIKPYWKVLIQWGDYMASTLPDPGNQLCTDDFEGPSPHNVNLAAKGIVGLASLSYLLKLDGQDSIAQKYDQWNKGFINFWMEKALDNDHYRLQYNLPGTWSLKYNLLFQKILKLNVFPQSIITTEQNFYSTKMNKFGVPLDDRADFTKADWEMWVAALANTEQFLSIVEALYTFLDETPDRTPFTDWYYTSSGKRRGFTARPVVGGVFAKVLTIEAWF